MHYFFKHNKVDIGTFCDALEHSKSRSTYSIHKGLCTALGKEEIMRYMGQIWFYSSSIAGATSQIQYYNGDDIKSDYAHTFNSEMKQNKTKKMECSGRQVFVFLVMSNVATVNSTNNLQIKANGLIFNQWSSDALFLACCSFSMSQRVPKAHFSFYPRWFTLIFGSMLLYCILCSYLFVFYRKWNKNAY